MSSTSRLRFQNVDYDLPDLELGVAEINLSTLLHRFNEAVLHSKDVSIKVQPLQAAETIEQKLASDTSPSPPVPIISPNASIFFHTPESTQSARRSPPSSTSSVPPSSALSSSTSSSIPPLSSAQNWTIVQDPGRIELENLRRLPSRRFLESLLPVEQTTQKKPHFSEPALIVYDSPPPPKPQGDYWDPRFDDEQKMMQAQKIINEDIVCQFVLRNSGAGMHPESIVAYANELRKSLSPEALELLPYVPARHTTLNWYPYADSTDFFHQYLDAKPHLSVLIHHRLLNTKMQMFLLLDTGADGCTLPLMAVDEGYVNVVRDGISTAVGLITIECEGVVYVDVPCQVDKMVNMQFQEALARARSKDERISYRAQCEADHLYQRQRLLGRIGFLNQVGFTYTPTLQGLQVVLSQAQAPVAAPPIAYRM